MDVHSELVVDPLRALRAAVKLVATVDLTEMSDAAIAGEVVSLRRSMDRLDGVFARWSLGAQGRGVGLADGHASMAAWLGWKTGIRRSAMNSVLRVAEVADLLEETGAAWRAGEISSGAMEAIASARVDGRDEELKACEPELLALARGGKHWALRQAAAHFRNFARGDGTAPDERDGVTLSKLLDGRTAMAGELHGIAAETVTTALEAFMDPPSDGDDRTAAQRRADALVRVCEVAMEHGTDAGRTKAQATFVIDWATLMSDAVGRLDAMFTGPIHRREIERLLCDCKLSRVVMGPDSLPLDIGRQSQSWPAGIRRAIVARDGGCRWPGCEVPAQWCDAHHWVQWARGGPTAVENGFLLCGRHHRFLHAYPDWSITFEDQVVRVFRPDGRELSRYPWLEESMPEFPDPDPSETIHQEPMLV